MSSCRLYINKFLLILFVFAMSSCTSEVISDIDSSILEIKNTYIEYDSSGILMARVQFTDESPLDELLSVEVEFQISEDIIFKEELYDDGTNGDFQAGNGSYSLQTEIALENLIYDVNFFVYTEVDTLNIVDQLDVGFYPPAINQVCMPEVYTINETGSDTFFVYISVEDFNGINNIKSVELELKKLQGYEIGIVSKEGSCEWEESVDDEYVDYDINLESIENYSLDNDCQILEEEILNNYIYFTPLVIDSFSSCGPHGPMSFKYIVEDKDGYTVSETRELLICHPGECE